MGKSAKVYFLTAYVEYLLDGGIRSEEVYLGDASRFLRHLISAVTTAEVEGYIKTHAHSAGYAKHLRRSLRKFYDFALQRLDIPCSPFIGVDDTPRP
jgi:hypothetical protein